MNGHKMSTSSPTIDLSPPPGYQPGLVLRFPILALNIVALMLACTLAPLLGVVLWFSQAGAADVFGRLLRPLDSMGIFAAAIVTIVTHELIHGTVLHYNGYHVTYGVSWRLLVAYAAAFGQFQQRRHALVNALAPLVAITVALTPLLLIAKPYVAVAACIALLINTTGAVGDLYVSWQLLRLPRETLLYDIDPAQMLIFIPSATPHSSG